MKTEDQIINLLSFHSSPNEAAELWKDFKKDVRARKKAPNTERAFKALLNILVTLEMQGQDPYKVVEQSYERGWVSFFPLAQDYRFNKAQKISPAEQAINIAIAGSDPFADMEIINEQPAVKRLN